jgi:hypothetical protein
MVTLTGSAANDELSGTAATTRSPAWADRTCWTAATAATR